MFKDIYSIFFKVARWVIWGLQEVRHVHSLLEITHLVIYVLYVCLI